MRKLHISWNAGLHCISVIIETLFFYLLGPLKFTASTLVALSFSKMHCRFSSIVMLWNCRLNISHWWSRSSLELRLAICGRSMHIKYTLATRRYSTLLVWNLELWLSSLSGLIGFMNLHLRHFTATCMVSYLLCWFPVGKLLLMTVHGTF